MDTRKNLNNSPMNAAAWSWETSKDGRPKDGISIGIYPKPTRKKLAEPAKSIVELYSDNGKLVCEVNIKRLDELGIKLVLNDKE